MVRVKICGLTSIEDAVLAAELGADALGFNFAEGPRRIAPDLAAEIVRKLPPFVVPVAVFVNELPEKICQICRDVGIRTVQLHGEEPPELLGFLPGLRVIKAFRVGALSDLENILRYRLETILLDAKIEGKRGGTGHTFNWELAAKVPQAIQVILSGGLSPENVAEAIRIARPYAVDVASGVESSPGKKDPDLMRLFIQEAHSALL